MLRRHLPSSSTSGLTTWVGLILGALLCIASLSSCGSTGSSSSSSSRLSAEDGTPARVTFVDYRTNVRMTLVNEAHTDPVKYYSEKRVTANTKITSNEVMAKMLEHFDDEGFNRHATGGYAPATGDGRSSLQSMEIETADGTIFIVNGEGTSDAARQSFRTCRTAFMQIQELTLQAQAVDNTDGKTVFKTPTSKN